MAVVYIRFLHIQQYYGSGITKIRCLNYLALTAALTTLLGLVIVGSFQVCPEEFNLISPPPPLTQDDTVLVAHFIGAHMVFLFGTVYMWLQTFISYRIYHASLTRHTSSVIIIVRLIISIVATVSYILSEWVAGGGCV